MSQPTDTRPTVPHVNARIDDRLIRQLAKTAFDRKGFPMTWESLPDELTFQTRLNYEQALIAFREAGLDLALITAVADGRVQALIEAAIYAHNALHQMGWDCKELDTAIIAIQGEKP